jgi:hypothetical protein
LLPQHPFSKGFIPKPKQNQQIREMKQEIGTKFHRYHRKNYTTAHTYLKLYLAQQITMDRYLKR